MRYIDTDNEIDWLDEVRQFKRRVTWIMLCIAVLFVLWLSGCTREIRHTWPDGSVTEYRNTGFNTTFDELDLENGQTHLRIKKFSSEAAAAEAVGKAADAVKAVAGKAPVLP